MVFPEGQEDAGSRQGRPSENPSRNVLCLQQGQGQRQDIQPKTGRAKFVYSPLLEEKKPFFPKGGFYKNSITMPCI